MTPRLPVLVFDGDCGVCTRAAAWCRRRLPPTVEVQPWQSLDLGALGLREQDVARAVYWVDTDRTLSPGHLAVGKVLQHIGGLWRVPAWLCRHAPTRWCAAVLYRAVAANRHRLPGSSAACRLPAGGERPAATAVTGSDEPPAGDASPGPAPAQPNTPATSTGRRSVADR